MDSRDLPSLLVLNQLSAGAVAREWTDLLLSGESASRLLKKIREENFAGKRDALVQLERRFDPYREIEACLSAKVSLVAITDPAYPALLREIYDPPLVLYVKGSLVQEDAAALAVVGSRHATAYGLYHARSFSSEIAAAGWTIVSGLARGIDQAAHEGALQTARGRTVAVLGCGVDVVYPRESRRLYEEIGERGAVLSEFSLGSLPLPHHFPRRNRIISGLSLGVWVVEAHVKSGSLITAREALEQGREVFAMPGRIDQLTSSGTHQLLRDGAILVDSVESILVPLAQATVNFREPGRLFAAHAAAGKPAAPSAAAPSLREQDLISSLLKEGDLTPDEIADKLGLGTADLAGRLMELELGGAVKKKPNGRFALR
ncbi:MAG TPA: DNA-processing protein DprA [Verrucomicrobiae bacterium]|nr:DNA-processing protein DprA [Verrucomicrobiae bacterium]